MFSEPPRTQYDLLFMLGRVPVRVHPMFWFMTLVLVYNSLSRPIDVLLWVVTVFVSIVIHEMGHVLAFHRFGYNAHIVLHGFGGLAIPDSARGRRIDTALSRVIIALAGPAAQILLAALILLLMYAAGIGAYFQFWVIKINIPGRGVDPGEHMETLLFFLLQVNIIWPLFNLLPVYPLDGSRVFRELLVRVNPHDGDRQVLILSAFTAAAIAVVAFARWRSYYTAMMFGYLAYMSYMMLESSGGFGRRRW